MEEKIGVRMRVIYGGQEKEKNESVRKKRRAVEDNIFILFCIIGVAKLTKKIINLNIN